MKLKKTIQVPDDHTQTTFTPVELEVDFNVSILVGTAIHVCAGYSDWDYVETGFYSYAN